MSSDTLRTPRRERRAATLAKRRAQRRRTAIRPPARFGLGTISVVAVAIGLLLVGFALLTRPHAASGPGPVVAASAPTGIPTDGMTLGAATAQVTVDVYEDFQCPVCLSWGRNVFPSLARNEVLAGKARLVFHSFQFIGPESRDAGRAAWAAAQQGRFWDMWATLYANQGPMENGGAFSHERLIAMASAIGLDETRFTADLDSAGASRAVAGGNAAADAAGVTATPTVAVNGVPVRSLDYPTLAAAIGAAAR